LRNWQQIKDGCGDFLSSFAGHSQQLPNRASFLGPKRRYVFQLLAIAIG
jgi:hypothetical protein